jgi:hypothetical protein
MTNWKSKSEMKRIKTLSEGNTIRYYLEVSTERIGIVGTVDLNKASIIVDGSRKYVSLLEGLHVNQMVKVLEEHYGKDCIKAFRRIDS